MLRSLLALLVQLAALLIVVVVAYNYFFGTADEKEDARALVSQVVGLGDKVRELVVSEKGKYDNGKYDAALEKTRVVIDSLRQRLAELGDKGDAYKPQLDELERQQADLEQRIRDLQDNSLDEQEPSYTVRTSNNVGAVLSNTAIQTVPQPIDVCLIELANQMEALGSQITE